MAFSVAARNLQIAFVWIVLMHCDCHCSTVFEENCIWRGSGSPDQSHLSVMRADLTCNQGELQWTEPYGGLRVTFHPPDVRQTGFRLCFSSQYPGVNIYKEGLKNLTLLKDFRESDTRKTICVTTTGEYVVLYLEAQESQKMAKLNYTVLVRGRKKPRHERRKECKPCRYSKLLESFCTSDFVVRGYINTTFPLGSGEAEQASVIATDVIRQRNSIFVKRRENDQEFFTSMRVPKDCHWKKSERQLLLLTGTVESGRGPVLNCHVKEEIWLQLKKDLILHLCRVLH